MPQQQQRQASSGSQHSSSSSGSSTTGSNSDVMEQLQGKGPELPEQNLGEMDSGSSFADMAGGILDAVAPGEGSAVKFKLTGKIPLYVTPAVSVYFKPSMEMGVARKSGKLEASMQLAAAVEVSAEVDAWLIDLEASLTASFSGTLKIVGDSGAEIFDEFLLSLRYIIEGACDTVSMPERIKNSIVTGIMSDEEMQDTIEGMDGKDKVELTLDAGLSGRASAGGLGASASANVSHAMTLQNNGNDQLEANSQTTTRGTVQIGPFTAERKWVDGKTIDTLSARKDIPILGQTVASGLKVQFTNEQLDKVQLTGSLSKEISWDDLADMMTSDNSWLNTIKNGVVQGIIQLNQQIDSPLLNNIAGRLDTSPTDVADATLSSMGEEVTTRSVSFDAKAKIKADTELSWQRGKGFAFKITISTDNSTSIGFGENKIEITQNDRLMQLTVGDAGLNIDFS